MSTSPALSQEIFIALILVFGKNLKTERAHWAALVHHVVPQRRRHSLQGVHHPPGGQRPSRYVPLQQLKIPIQNILTLLITKIKTILFNSNIKDKLTFLF